MSILFLVKTIFTLPLAYSILLSDPDSEFYDVNVSDLPILTPQPPETPRLPHPSQEKLLCQKLLNNPSFLQTLRQVFELKLNLDQRNHSLVSQSPTNPPTDIIYAETVIQFDGKVINRYPQHLLTHPYKDLILHLHQYSLDVGKKQWQSLLHFMVEVIQKLK